MSIRGAREGVSFFSEEKHYSTFPGAPCHSDDIEFRRSRSRELEEPPRVLGVLWDSEQFIYWRGGVAIFNGLGILDCGLGSFMGLSLGIAAACGGGV